MTDNCNFHILTGGPGSGKTSVLTALAARGHACEAESGRGIIQAQVARGGSALPWKDREAFARLMEQADRDAYDRVSNSAHRGPVFFDRGLPDIAGYRLLEDLPVPDSLARDCGRRRYAGTIFIAPPWAEIYERDSERKQSLAEAVRTCGMMAHVYASLGYKPVQLPCSPVEARVDFILSHIGERGGGESCFTE